MPLYGDLPAEQQDAVLAPCERRKLVLATNVAETSITIDGVTAVVDTGQARVLRFDEHVGLDRLELSRISKASADQRAGRAGRTQPGICLRLWSERDHRGLADHEDPEIRRVDLAGPVLQLLRLGRSRRCAAFRGSSRRAKLGRCRPKTFCAGWGRPTAGNHRARAGRWCGCRCIRASRGCCWRDNGWASPTARPWRPPCSPSATRFGAIEAPPDRRRKRAAASVGIGRRRPRRGAGRVSSGPEPSAVRSRYTQRRRRHDSSCRRRDQLRQLVRDRRSIGAARSKFDAATLMTTSRCSGRLLAAFPIASRSAAR